MKRLIILTVIIGASWCMPKDVEPTPQKNYQQGRAVEQAPINSQAVNNQYAFYQTVRKIWRCNNGECEEKTINCKNGNCDSLQSRFKAENYQPELPQLEPIPFPSNFNFASVFNSNFFPKIELPPSPQFENTGEVDLVLNNQNQLYYFANAKYVNQKCINGVCEIRTKTCKNGKCEESVATKKL